MMLSKKVIGPSAFPIIINHQARKNIASAPKIPVVKANDRTDILIPPYLILKYYHFYFGFVMIYVNFIV